MGRYDALGVPVEVPEPELPSANRPRDRERHVQRPLALGLGLGVKCLQLGAPGLAYCISGALTRETENLYEYAGLVWGTARATRNVVVGSFLISPARFESV